MPATANAVEPKIVPNCPMNSYTAVEHGFEYAPSKLWHDSYLDGQHDFGKLLPQSLA